VKTDPKLETKTGNESFGRIFTKTHFRLAVGLLRFVGRLQQYFAFGKWFGADPEGNPIRRRQTENTLLLLCKETPALNLKFFVPGKFIIIALQSVVCREKLVQGGQLCGTKNSFLTVSEDCLFEVTLKSFTLLVHPIFFVLVDRYDTRKL